MLLKMPEHLNWLLVEEKIIWLLARDVKTRTYRHNGIHPGMLMPRDRRAVTIDIVRLAIVELDIAVKHKTIVKEQKLPHPVVITRIEWEI